jgi:hypothetical protein
LTGQQQLPGASPTDEQRVVQVGAQLAVYALNPAPLQMFLGLFLALGGILDRGKLRYVAPATVYLIGFIVGLTRSWYVFIGAGVLVMLLVMALLAPHQRARASARPLVALLSLGAILAVTLARVSQGEGNLSLAGLWAQRAATLFSVQNDPSYQVRVATLSAQWQHVLAKPLFGYGLSNDGYEFVANLGRQDTGLVNSLLLFGFIGIIPFVVLILHGFRHSIAAYRRLSDSDERGYVLGLAGVWVGLTVGYIFDWDFMTSINGPWLPVLALGILDRASRLTK